MSVTFISPDGSRVTTERAYLTSEVLARKNLKVITHAHVTRILFDKSGQTPRAVGVEFSHGKDQKYRVKAKKEVIVSCVFRTLVCKCARLNPGCRSGAVHSPQILMLSGIGPAEHLASHGIPIVADLPGVGSHLMDHIVIDLNYRDKTNSSLAGIRGESFSHSLSLMKALFEYRVSGRGPLSTNVSRAHPGRQMLTQLAKLPNRLRRRLDLRVPMTPRSSRRANTRRGTTKTRRLAQARRISRSSSHPQGTSSTVWSPWAHNITSPCMASSLGVSFFHLAWLAALAE